MWWLVLAGFASVVTYQTIHDQLVHKPKQKEMRATLSYLNRKSGSFSVRG